MNNNFFERFNKKRCVYKEVFNTPQGQKILQDLYVFCGQNRSTHVAGDPYGSAYNEGMRRVFLRIQQFVNVDEKKLQQILNQPQGE